MTKKPPSKDPVKPEKDEAERSRTGPEIVGRLSKTLASDRNQKFVAGARKLVEEHEKLASSKAPSPDGESGNGAEEAEEAEILVDEGSVADKEEVDAAATTLTSAVDQMVPSLLLSLGMLDVAIKWMKFVVVLILVAIVLLVILVENGIRTANSNKRAADSVDASRLELVEIKKSMIDVRKADARREIIAATEPKLVAGDKPGEVAIISPDVSQEEIELAQKKAEEAVEKGEKLPKPPTSKGATKIPVKLGEGKKESRRKGPRPLEQAPPPPD